MKRLSSTTACAALLYSITSPAASQVVQPQVEQQAELTEARSIIGIMFPPAQRQQMTEKMLDDIVKPMRDSQHIGELGDPGLKAIVDAALDKMMVTQRAVVQRHMPALLEAMATAYSNEFSLAELKDIRTFAQSPSGSRYLSRSTAIVGDPAVMKVNRELFAASNAASATVLPEFRARLSAYLVAHPELTARRGAGRPK